MVMQHAGVKREAQSVTSREEYSPRRTILHNKGTCSLLLPGWRRLVSALLWRSQRLLQQATDGAALQQQVQQLQKQEALPLSPFQHTCTHASPGETCNEPPEKACMLEDGFADISAASSASEMLGWHGSR